MTCNKGKQVYKEDSRFLVVVVCLFLFPYLLLCFDIKAADTTNTAITRASGATIDLLSPEHVIYKPIVEAPSLPTTTRSAADSKLSAVPRIDASKKTLGQLRANSEKEVIELIKIHASTYGLNPDLPLRIAKCESGHRANAKNKSSTASGVFQYLAGTWANTSAGRAGISVFDADANIRMAITHIATKGTSPWASSKSCWNT